MNEKTRPELTWRGGDDMLFRHLKTTYGLVEVLVWIIGLLSVTLVSLLLVDGTRFRASADFLSDAIAFESVVVSVAIPVGLEVVGRLYDKYGSNRVKTFLAYRVRLVPLMLTVFANVVLVLCLKAMNANDHPVLGILALIGGITTAALFWLFLDRIVDFVINEPEAVLEQMRRLVVREFES